MATRDDSVPPKRTAVAGGLQRAVESTYPWPSVPGAAAADVAEITSSTEHAATAAIGRGAASPKDAITFHETTADAVLRAPIPSHCRIVRSVTPKPHHSA